MPIVLSRANKVALGAIALSSISLLAGFIAGRMTSTVEQNETMVVPASSMKNLKPELPCTQNRAFSDFVRGEDIHIQSQVTQLHVQTTALFDRGVICHMVGEVGRADMVRHVSRRERFNIFLMVAATGDSEIISEDLAKALAASHVLSAMASNIGNDGTVVPVPKIGKITIDGDKQ